MQTDRPKLIARINAPQDASRGVFAWPIGHLPLGNFDPSAAVGRNLIRAHKKPIRAGRKQGA